MRTGWLSTEHNQISISFPGDPQDLLARFAKLQNTFGLVPQLRICRNDLAKPLHVSLKRNLRIDWQVKIVFIHYIQKNETRLILFGQ